MSKLSGRQVFRMATSTERKHYSDLIRPVAEYMRSNPINFNVPPPADMVKLFTETAHAMERFGFQPTALGLFVRIQDTDQDPDLDDAAREAVDKELAESLAKMMGKSP